MQKSNTFNFINGGYTAAAFEAPSFLKALHIPSFSFRSFDQQIGPMKRLIRRLSRISDATDPEASSPLSPKQSSPQHRRRVPPGHVPVRVGDEEELFAVRTDLLSRPAFVELLRLSAQEYGYSQTGALRIPCSAAFFRRLLVSGAAVIEDPSAVWIDDDGFKS
jgi:hypothetical protein